jgi:hypothetical protein
MIEIASRLLGRKEIRAIKKNTNVDIHRLMLDVMKTTTTGEDIKTDDLLEHMTPDVIDAVVDCLFPNDPRLDSMSYMELTSLVIETLAKTFGGEVEKK